MKMILFLFISLSFSFGVEKLGYDFTKPLTLDLNNQKELEAVGKALRVHDFLVEQIAWQKKLIQSQEKTLADIERKRKFEKAMKITGIVLGVLGGFAAGFGLAYGIAKLRR